MTLLIDIETFAFGMPGGKGEGRAQGAFGSSITAWGDVSMPAKIFEATVFSVADTPPTAELNALSSNELMVARKLAYQPGKDALEEDAFWVEYMETEDNCMAARHVWIERFNDGVDRLAA